uniref:Uncharacterized protein n=1 Tax=Brassica oleracea TaxID=3712 RepID=A0A3P6FU30_BRAOL|nr:unnamed protein product [Brassica oleracea]
MRMSMLCIWVWSFVKVLSCLIGLWREGITLRELLLLSLRPSWQLFKFVTVLLFVYLQIGL